MFGLKIYAELCPHHNNIIPYYVYDGQVRTIKSSK